VAPILEAELPPARMAPLEPLLRAEEIERVRAALVRVRPAASGPATFRAPPANTGEEPYSAWFGDVDRAGVLYFGLSPFWTLWWQSGGDANADRALPGDWLIGRFDLATEHFLAPLRVRAAADGVRSSIWDVLVHSNGRVYFTTFFEALGSARLDGSDVRLYPGLGAGLNEMVEGPDGNLWITRYADDPLPEHATGSGAVAVISPDGRLLREHRFPGAAGTYTAPKSLALDPATGEVWLNTDTFGPAGSVAHEAIRLAPDGRVLERASGPAELHFPAFDARGRGWLAESEGGRLRVRVREAGRDVAALDLGPRGRLDFVQEVRPTAEGGAILVAWSGRAWRVRPRADGFEVAEIRFDLPPECRPPEGRSLAYTAVVHRGSAYATLFCGARVLRAPLPP
jgi:streptogramin lyase